MDHAKQYKEFHKLFLQGELVIAFHKQQGFYARDWPFKVTEVGDTMVICVDKRGNERVFKFNDWRIDVIYKELTDEQREATQSKTNSYPTRPSESLGNEQGKSKKTAER